MPEGEVQDSKGVDTSTVEHAKGRIEGLFAPAKEEKKQAKGATQDDSSRTEHADDDAAESDDTADGEESTEAEDGDDSQDDDSDDSDDRTSDEDDDSESDDEDTAGEKSEKQRLHDVVIDGKKERVTLDELRAGYQRNKDYSQKTQEHSAAIKKWQAEEVEPVRHLRRQYEEQLGIVEDVLSALVPDDAVWATLEKELDPEEFKARFTDVQKTKAQLKKIQDARKQQQDAMGADEQAQAENLLRDEGVKLVSAIPSWSDAKVADKEKKEIFQYALKLGFEEKLLSGIADHRYLVMLRNAMLYEKGKTVTPKGKNKIREAIKDSRPSGERREQVAPERRKVQAAIKRARVTGRVEDAASAMEHLM